MPRKRRRRRNKNRQKPVVLGSDLDIESKRGIHYDPKTQTSYSGAYTDQDIANTIGKKFDSTYGGVHVVGGTKNNGTYGTWRQCTHWREPVELAEGIMVTASAWFDRPRLNSDIVQAEIGVYFDSSWIGPSTITSKGWRGPPIGHKNQLCVVSWADYGVPSDFHSTLKVLEYALNKAGEGRHVDIGCLGAHGRTGTALAAMQVLLGVEPDEAMEWVWQKYCWNGIESKAQEDWIRRVWNFTHKRAPEGVRVLDLDWKEKEDKPTTLTVNETGEWVTTNDGPNGVTPQGKAILDDMLESGEVTVEQWCEWTGLSPENLPPKILEQNDDAWLRNLEEEYKKEQAKFDPEKFDDWCSRCDQHLDYCYCVYAGYDY